MAAFVDRADAGRQLGVRLTGLAGLAGADVVVVGLSRGGVPVAFEVARALAAPLDVVLVRKVGVPGQPELAMGAIAEGGVRVVNDETVRMAQVGEGEFAAVEAREAVELARRAQLFRAGRPRVPLAGRTVVVVDDGIATGSTAIAACQAVRAQGAARLVLAAPVTAGDRVLRLRAVVDDVVSVVVPEAFFGVAEFYDDFTQTSDEEVIDLLQRSTDHVGQAVDVAIPTPLAVLSGRLSLPAQPRAVVVFAHGSGSGWDSPRGRFVADALTAAGLATLRFDLLGADEQADEGNVFDIALLARRLQVAANWLRAEPATAALPLGLFGASTGAAAALWAASEPGADIDAVVSRGGRPDLAWDRLPSVTAPTLLIVGGRDDWVLELNRQADRRLVRCESRVVVVPGATHLFAEPGALTRAAVATRTWFLERLAQPSDRAQPTGYATTSGRRWPRAS